MSRWTIDTVFERVVEAARTARHLPKTGGPGRITYWPDFVRSYWEAYQDDAAPLRPRPTARQIEEFDEVTVWLAWLQRAGQEYTKTVWARAATKASWRKIGAKMGVSHTKASYTFRVGVALLLHGLDSGELKGEPRRPGRNQEF